MPDWRDLLGAIDDVPPPDLPGFTIERLLGERGQSAVFAGRDPLGRPVAVKRWKVSSPRATREARSLATVDHPGVVRVRDLVTDAATGLPCVIMDLIDAPPLLADGRALPSRRAAQVIAQVAEALDAVHRVGLVHRDVKPDNVLLPAGGRPVLVDFGVVKPAAPDAGPTTLTGAPAPGTRPYMAPEQLGLLDAPVGPASDVYALGVTLYQCLTGALPFESDAAYERQTRDVWRAPQPGAAVDRVDAGLRAVVAACLAFDPAQRPATAGALAERLEAWSPQRRSRLPWVAAGLLGLAGLVWVVPVDRERPSAPVVASPAPTTQVLRLQPGPLEGRDTYVDEVGWYRNDNFGAEQTLRVGRRPQAAGQPGEQRGLIAFGLERLPAGAEITAAWLELVCHDALYVEADSVIEARAVVPSGARTPWREGTGLHDAWVDGVVWDGAFAGQADDARTASARPELSQPDAATEALDAVTVSPPGEPPVPRPARWNVTAAVQAWRRDPAANLGLRLAPTAGAGTKLFWTSDAVDPAVRPRLEIHYRGAAPTPAPAELPAQRAAQARARALLDRARALDDPRRALGLAAQAVTAAPFWGQAFLGRAQQAERLGLGTLARIDAARAHACLVPSLGAGVYAVVARQGLALRSPQPWVQALAALTVLAYEQRMTPEVEALYRLAVQRGLLGPADRSAWGAWAASMLRRLEISRARTTGGEGVPRVLDQVVRAGRSPRVEVHADAAACADWTRALLAVGQPAAALRQLEQGRETWSQDAELEALAGCLGR